MHGTCKKIVKQLLLKLQILRGYEHKKHDYRNYYLTFDTRIQTYIFYCV